MTNLTANTLVDLIERGNRIRTESAQFERDIWAIRAEGFRQLADTIKQTPSGILSEAVKNAADDYVADYDSHGILEDKIEALLAATTQDLTSDNPGDELFTQGIGGLCEAIIEAGKAWRQGTALFNRSGIFFYMPVYNKHFGVLKTTFDDWARLAGVTPADIPESPYYQNTSVIIRETTFDAMVKRGAGIATAAAGFAEEISLIRETGENPALLVLQVQANELSKRAAKFLKMENHPAYEGLLKFFETWKEYVRLGKAS
jgi:hypothetical protein